MTKMHNLDGRVQAAGLGAKTAYQRLRRKAESLLEEMDEVTAPINIRVSDLDEEDSMVISVERVIHPRAKTA